MKPEIKQILQRLSDLEDKIAYILGEDVSEDTSEGEDMASEEEDMNPKMKREHRRMMQEME